MLIVHPTSSCDVCLERYAWDAPSGDEKPHVITCGHVFCLRCLQNLRIPRTCPLCRRSFHLTRAVRVHADLASGGGQVLTNEEREARRLEAQLAQAALAADDTVSLAASADNSSSIESVATAGDAFRLAVDEALEWLDGSPTESHPTLRAAITLLNRLALVRTELYNAQDAIQRAQNERDGYRRRIRRMEHNREQERLIQQGIDSSWTTKITDITRDYEKKLTEADARNQSLESEYTRCRRELEDLQSAHTQAQVDREADALAQAQAEASNSQSQEQSQFNHKRLTDGVAFPTSSSSPLPPARQQAVKGAESNVHGIIARSSNPLPRPPEPIPLSRLPAFARPRSGSRAYEVARALTRAARKDKARQREGGASCGGADSERDRVTGGESEKDKGGKYKEKDKRREKGKGRERDVDNVNGTSGAESTHRQTRERRHSERERDRGMETSATEAQERQRRARTVSAALSGVAADPDASALPTLPRDVIGGWGLERSWRASLASSISGSDLRSAATDTGTSHTRLLRMDKGKGRERPTEIDLSVERERMRRDGEHKKEDISIADDQEYVHILNPVERAARQRHSYASFGTRDKTVWDQDRGPITDMDKTRQHDKQKETEMDRDSAGVRERRTTLASLPSGSSSQAGHSALGLVLVPSRSGTGHEYRYITLPPQSSIQVGGSSTVTSGKSSVLDYGLAPTGTAVPRQNAQLITSVPEGRTLSRRATDSELQAHHAAQANTYTSTASAAPPVPVHLHVPQPRRFSHILQPPPDDETEPEREQEHGYERGRDKGREFPIASAHPIQVQASTTSWERMYGNPNLSLDSSLARISSINNQYARHQPRAQPEMLADNSVADSQLQDRELRHKSSNASTSTTSTGSIPLTGTSRERRMQLLEALFTDHTAQQSLQSLVSIAAPSAIAPAVALSTTDGSTTTQFSLGRIFSTEAADSAGVSTTVQPATTAVCDTSTIPGFSISSTSRLHVHATDRVRGVPSVDGRPSRGLSTRPSTVQPLSSHHTVHHIAQHFRQATFPPQSTTASTTAAAAYSSYVNSSSSDALPEQSVPALPFQNGTAYVSEYTAEGTEDSSSYTSYQASTASGLVDITSSAAPEAVYYTHAHPARRAQQQEQQLSTSQSQAQSLRHLTQSPTCFAEYSNMYTANTNYASVGVRVKGTSVN